MDYAAFATTSDALIKRYGKALTLVHREPATYNVSTGTATPTNVTSTIQGVVLDYPRREVDGTQIMTGDKKVLVSPSLTSVPVPGDTVVDGTQRMSVLAVETLAPAGTPVLYTLQCRIGA